MLTRKQRETGKYAVRVNLYSYDGYTVEGIGTITPITEKFRKSGRGVEVQLSSMYGDGHACLEFYGVKGAGDMMQIP